MQLIAFYVIGFIISVMVFAVHAYENCPTERRAVWQFSAAWPAVVLYSVYSGESMLEELCAQGEEVDAGKT